MADKKLKYQQKVYAKITRLYDQENKEYHFLRNDTRIIFGNGGRLLGTVIMSNPGSFEFRNNPDWNDFRKGYGNEDMFESVGTPDPTMINIIKAVEGAYALKSNTVPNGYVKILNLSSVRCPNGDGVLEVHSRVEQLLEQKGQCLSILQDPYVYNESSFKSLCDESNFIILGFLKNFLNEEALRVMKWTDIHGAKKKSNCFE